MPSLKYLIKRVRTMNTQNMRLAAARIAKQTRRPRLVILADMALCGIRHGAGYMDYELFGFQNKSDAQRRTYLTRGRSNDYVRALNDPSAWKIFDSKPLFLEHFKEYCPRKWAELEKLTPGKFERFGTELGEFIAKPPDASHGDGVEKIRAAEVDDWAALRERLIACGSTLLEEVVKQHDDMNAMCSGSVNTVRIVTLVRDGKAHIVGVCLRVGGGSRPVDNFNGGGMVTVVDRESGKVLYPAVARDGTAYDAHPLTGAKFVGTQLPMWRECREFVERAALEVPGVKYVAWDVAITPTGPTFVEGNHFPGHDLHGLEAHSPDGYGVLPAWEEVYTLDELKKMMR